MTNLVERGLVRPVIGAVLPLERIGEGHEVLETGSRRGLRGKVAIDVSGEAEIFVPPLTERNDAWSRDGATLANTEWRTQHDEQLAPA